MSIGHENAFPIPSMEYTDDDGEKQIIHGVCGITRLEYFAAEALKPLLANVAEKTHASVEASQIAIKAACFVAFDAAEAMCAEAEKRKGTK